MRIGIDIDGVLTDIEKYQLDCGSKYVSEHFDKGIVNADGYEISDIFEISHSCDNNFWEEYLYKYAKEEPARKYASEVIQKLKNEGNEIYIITARYLTDKNDGLGVEMREIVKKWLSDNKIYYDKLIFSPEEKLEICKENHIDLMIEDKVDNINKISQEIPVICFNAGYNKECIGTNIFRCYSWYDIYTKIKNMAKHITKEFH